MRSYFWVHLKRLLLPQVMDCRGQNLLSSTTNGPESSSWFSAGHKFKSERNISNQRDGPKGWKRNFARSPVHHGPLNTAMSNPSNELGIYHKYHWGGDQRNKRNGSIPCMPDCLLHSSRFTYQGETIEFKSHHRGHNNYALSLAWGRLILIRKYRNQEQTQTRNQNLMQKR